MKKLISEEVIFAYLFGSLVEGKDGEMSDIDIAVYIDRDNLPETGTFGYRSEMIVKLQQVAGKEVDFVILNDVSVIMAHEVLAKGRLLFTRSEAERRKFHEKTMDKYLDCLRLYKVQESYQRDRLLQVSSEGINMEDKMLIKKKLNQP